MKIKLFFRNLKFRSVALWWLLTRKYYYLLSFNDNREGSTSLESFNVNIPEFTEWLRAKHGAMTNMDIRKELRNIYEAAGSDTLVASMCKDLIDKLRDQYEQE